MNLTTTTPTASPSLEQMRAEKARLDALLATAEREERERVLAEETKAKNVARIAGKLLSFQKELALSNSIVEAISLAGGGELKVVCSASVFAGRIPSGEELEAYYLAQIDKGGYCGGVTLRIEEGTPTAGHPRVAYYNGTVEVTAGCYHRSSRPRIYRSGKNGFNLAGIARAYIEEKEAAVRRLSATQREDAARVARETTLRHLISSTPSPAPEGIGKGQVATLSPSRYDCSKFSISLPSLTEEEAQHLLAALAALGFRPHAGF